MRSALETTSIASTTERRGARALRIVVVMLTNTCGNQKLLKQDPPHEFPAQPQVLANTGQSNRSQTHQLWLRIGSGPTEDDRGRDPFRNYAEEFLPRATNTGAEVGFDRCGIRRITAHIRDLQLVAVVTGVRTHYAVVSTQTGDATHILRLGDYVPVAPRIVAEGPNGLGLHAVPWRVARIVAARTRVNDAHQVVGVPASVVLASEDLLTPNRNLTEVTLWLVSQANPVSQVHSHQASTDHFDTPP